MKIFKFLLYYVAIHAYAVTVCYAACPTPKQQTVKTTEATQKMTSFTTGSASSSGMTNESSESTHKPATFSTSSASSGGKPNDATKSTVSMGSPESTLTSSSTMQPTSTNMATLVKVLVSLKLENFMNVGFSDPLVDEAFATPKENRTEAQQDIVDQITESIKADVIADLSSRIPGFSGVSNLQLTPVAGGRKRRSGVTEYTVTLECGITVTVSSNLSPAAFMAAVMNVVDGVAPNGPIPSNSELYRLLTNPNIIVGEPTVIVLTTVKTVKTTSMGGSYVSDGPGEATTKGPDDVTVVFVDPTTTADPYPTENIQETTQGVGETTQQEEAITVPPSPTTVQVVTDIEKGTTERDNFTTKIAEVTQSHAETTVAREITDPYEETTKADEGTVAAVVTTVVTESSTSARSTDALFEGTTGVPEITEAPPTTTIPTTIMVEEEATTNVEITTLPVEETTQGNPITEQPFVTTEEIQLDTTVQIEETTIANDEPTTDGIGVEDF